MILRAPILSTVRQVVRESSTAVLRGLHRQVAYRRFSASRVRVTTIASRIAARVLFDRPAAWWLGSTLVIGIMLTAATHEMRTSALQAWVLSHSATQLSYTLRPGASPRIVFPEAGPFDERLGYTRIAEFQRRLETQGYAVTAQVRFSDPAARFAAWGVLPPYTEPPEAGLVIRDRDGARLYYGVPTHGTFRDLAEVPPLIVNTLLFIEDRRLQEPADPRTNPVLDWPRLAKAATLYAGRKLGLPLPVQGGSTLATQLEKFQHSRDGSTGSPWEKLRQVVSASIRVYRQGADTRIERQEILLQYLNKVPLSAAPGWGEVNGLGSGLVAWFGIQPAEALEALASPSRSGEAARVYKHVLALLCAVRAPTHYLVHDRAALEARVAGFIPLLSRASVIDEEFAARLAATPITFVRSETVARAQRAHPRKVVDRVRVHLGHLLGEANGYNLDRLHLEADTTIDRDLQEDVEAFFAGLQNRNYLMRQGLVGNRLLNGGDPRDVLYSFLLLERTPLGNAVRARADSLERPFDLNEGLKMELGSTAKLRTLAHYLEVMADLGDALARLDQEQRSWSVRAAGDPLTRWAAETLHARPGLALETFLHLALDRIYSASPAEVFFTGGGAHAFANFARDENSQTYSVRQGLIHSVNLVYIRLMRDLVRYHTARLPYDARAVLADPAHPERSRLLAEIADAESRTVLSRAYREYKGLPEREVERRLLGRRAADPRRLAILFHAWHPGAREGEFARWLALRVGPMPTDRVRRLAQAYGSPQLTLADFAYLLQRNPLEIWLAGELVKAPEVSSWDALLLRSRDPARAASGWLFQSRNRRPQEVRLRARIEQDAFARMTPAWQGLGFPFEHLVPSLATAIGSSSDRPDALAELLAIIRNDGVRDPLVSIRAIHLAAGTPYETALERAPARGKRVMHPVVARLLREVLHGVVQDGTARRVAGIFTDGARTALAIGGKTGSGDNRAKKVARDGRMVGSRPLSRTATFAFYLGDRHVGVITAIVTGSKAGDYRFTSALPVTMLRLMAPILTRHLQLDALPPGSPTIVAAANCASQNVDPSACPTSRAGRQPNRIVRQGLSLGLVRNTLSCPLAPSCAPPDTPLVGELRGDGQWADCGACPTYTQRPWCWQIDHPGRCAPRERDVAPVTEAILAPEPPRMRLIISSG